MSKIGRFDTPMNIEETWSLFRIFDRDSDGLISIQDFRDSLASFGDVITYDGAKDLICVGDTDGDGYLNLVSNIVIRKEKGARKYQSGTFLHPYLLL